MTDNKLSIEIPLKAEFYDVDSMKIVWHGNYIKYYEQARCALLDLIGYNYDDMERSGFAWPIVTLEVKYMKPIAFRQEFIIKATLLEYENRIKIAYLIYDKKTGESINKGITTQMAINMETGLSQLVSPPLFIQSVEDYFKEKVLV